MIQSSGLHNKVLSELRKGTMISIFPIPPEQWSREMDQSTLMWIAEVAFKTKHGDWRRAKGFDEDPEKALRIAMRTLFPPRNQKSVKKPRR